MNVYATACRIGLAIGAVCLVASCGGSPAQPSTPGGTSTATLTVSGLERLIGPLTPGVKAQLVASLTQPGGSKQDCTATATWATSDEKLLKLTGQQPGEFVAVAAGDVSASAVCAGTTGRLTIRVEKATSLAISGRLIEAPDGAPITNATITFGGGPAVQPDAAGHYSLVTTDNSVQPLLITAPGYQTRETSLRGGESRTLDLDLISNSSAFPFTMYRAMARNAFESPSSASVAPTAPWTSKPNVYIWTTWKDSGLPVANVDYFIEEIRRVIPQLSGGRLEAGTIEQGPTERPLTPGWIMVQFHRSGNSSYVGPSRGQVQFGGDHRCYSYAIIHEFGHAMGYWHSGIQPTIMGGGPVPNCDPANLTAAEQMVARVMYSRPPGNVEPDRDPSSSAQLRGSPGPATLVYCDNLIPRR
jgi:hypothetical protein